MSINQPMGNFKAVVILETNYPATYFHSDTTMLVGTIQLFDEAKGFDFIKPDTSERDVFVPVSGLVEQVKEGNRVNYQVQQGKKGPETKNVELTWFISFVHC